MSITVTTQFANPDPGIKFTTQQDEINLLNSLVTTTIAEDIAVYVKGSSTPAVEDQDKAWIRLDGSGRPQGLYVYYSGFWVPLPPSPGAQWGLYFGNPTIDFDGDGRGLKGVGPVAATYYGWQLMNGKNGVANWSDRFLIGGRMDNVGITGYSGAWQTNVRGTPEVAAGTATITTDVNTTYRKAQSGIVVGLWDSDSGQARHSSGALYGLASGDDTLNTTLNAADPGNLTPLAINVVNPFYAAAYMQFTGYTY